MGAEGGLRLGSWLGGGFRGLDGLGRFGGLFDQGVRWHQLGRQGIGGTESRLGGNQGDSAQVAIAEGSGAGLLDGRSWLRLLGGEVALDDGAGAWESCQESGDDNSGQYYRV